MRGIGRAGLAVGIGLLSGLGWGSSLIARFLALRRCCIGGSSSFECSPRSKLWHFGR